MNFHADESLEQLSPLKNVPSETATGTTMTTPTDVQDGNEICTVCERACPTRFMLNGLCAECELARVRKAPGFQHWNMKGGRHEYNPDPLMNRCTICGLSREEMENQKFDQGKVT